MKKPIKIVLVSDNHGNPAGLDYVREKHRGADYFIHCGDAELPTWMLTDFSVVQGNNDGYGQFPSRLIMPVGEHQIYICHGHRDMFFGHFDMLAAKAKEAGCDICFFGHTHIPYDQVIDGVRVINPGSIWHNRDGSAASYKIVTLNGKKVDVAEMTYEKKLEKK